MEKRTYSFDLQLNSITETTDPTKSEVTFIIHDFEVSHNHAFITKENAQKQFETLRNMPIVCQYYPVSESGADDDALGSHGMVYDKSRSTGEAFVTTDSIAIGVFTDPAYIETIDVDGEEKEVVMGKGILWKSRYPNIVSLIDQWYEEGISVSSSMEILYDEYRVKDGITEITNFVYEGHCLLNSESRGNHNKVAPAYDVSKLTRMVAEALNIEQKEDNMFKKVFELSHDDVRVKLYEKFDISLEEKQASYISDVYDTYFIVNVYSWGDNDEDYSDAYYKFEYSKEDDKIEIDLESKKEVFLKRNWEEVVEEDVEKVKLEKELSEIKVEKVTLEGQFNDATEKLTQLNSLVEELKPFKEQFETEQMEKALSEKKDFYSTKFEALGAKEKFESEEVQGLIQKAVCEVDESQKAILQLNSILVDLVNIEAKPETTATTAIKEMASKRENLLPKEESFDSRYSL